MPRRSRIATGGYVYHVLNRAVGRMTLFVKDEDYTAFERVLRQTLERFPEVELFCYCVMPNHWHLLLRPMTDGVLSEFMRLLTVTHSQRYHAHYHTSGTGPIYQGRFKSFPVQTERYFVVAARYVERNALRAGLVERAEAWRWSSLWAREEGSAELRGMLSDWPISGGAPRRWLDQVNAPQSLEELESLRAGVRRGRPFGAADWAESTAEKLGLGSSLRPLGRPKKQ